MDRTRRKHTLKFFIWQCNCTGYRCKRANLQQHLLTVGLEGAPDVIALRETNGQAKLLGFQSFIPVDSTQGEESSMLVTTIVRRNIPAIQYFTGIQGADHELLVLISASALIRGNLFILNVYSSPRKKASFFQATQENSKFGTIENTTPCGRGLQCLSVRLGVRSLHGPVLTALVGCTARKPNSTH